MTSGGSSEAGTTPGHKETAHLLGHGLQDVGDRLGLVERHPGWAVQRLNNRLDRRHRGCLNGGRDTINIV